MKNKTKILALLMVFLIVSLPVVFAEEFTRVYDANGNLQTNGKRFYKYNSMNQLVSVYNGASENPSQILETYKYHPSEERIIQKKIYHKGILNTTIFYPFENYVYIVNGSGEFSEVYVKDGEITLAQRGADGNKQAVHSDHIGSVSLLTDSNGNVVEETFYSAYGEILSGGTASRFDYENREYDSLTEDYDFRFRKYDPNIIVYNQPDDRIEPYNPQSLNRYLFEEGNPLINTDPAGHLAFVPLILIGAGAGFAASTAYQFTTEGKVDWKEAGKSALVGAGVSLFLAALPVIGTIATSIGGGTATEVVLEFAYSFGLSTLTEISENKKPETEKVLTEEEPQCGITVSCQREEIEGRGETRGQPKGIPSTLSTGNQANVAKTVTPPSSSGSIGSNSDGGGRGITEVSSGRRKIGISGGRVVYNIPSSAKYSSGFSSQLGSGKMKKSRGRR